MEYVNVVLPVYNSNKNKRFKKNYKNKHKKHRYINEYLNKVYNIDEQLIKDDVVEMIDINNKMYIKSGDTILPIFIIDSGASTPMVNDITAFTSIREKHVPIKLANGKIIYSYGIGDIGVLKNILYVPQLEFNLLSVSYLNNIGYNVIFHRTGNVIIEDMNNNSNIICSRNNNVYESNRSIFDIKEFDIRCMLSQARSTRFWLWHKRLCHINDEYVRQAINQKLIIGVDNFDIGDHMTCDACNLNKLTRKPVNMTPGSDLRINNSNHNFSEPLQFKSSSSDPVHKLNSPTNSKSILHNKELMNKLENKALIKFSVDIKGPLPYSVNRNRYCLLFTSNTSRYRYCYFLKEKNTLDSFKDFINEVKRLNLNIMISLNTTDTKDLSDSIDHLNSLSVPIEIKC